MYEQVADGVVVWHDQAGIGNERYSMRPEVNRRRSKEDIAAFTTAVVAEPTSDLLVDGAGASTDTIVIEQPSNTEAV